jgi:hypothetical protein
VASGAALDLLALPLGAHVVRVRAEDLAGNVAEVAANVELVATFDSLQAVLDRLVPDDVLGASLQSKLDNARRSADRDRAETAAAQLESLASEADAQRGKHLPATSAAVLAAEARALAASLAR